MAKYKYHLGDYVRSQSGVIYKIIELDWREKYIKGEIIRTTHDWYDVGDIMEIDYNHDWTFPKKLNTPLYKVLNG